MAPQPPGRRLPGQANSFTGSTSLAPVRSTRPGARTFAARHRRPPAYKDDSDWSAGISGTGPPLPGPVSRPRRSAVQPGGRRVPGGPELSGIGADRRKPGVPGPGPGRAGPGPWTDRGGSRPCLPGGSPRHFYTQCALRPACTATVSRSPSALVPECRGPTRKASSGLSLHMTTF